MANLAKKLIRGSIIRTLLPVSNVIITFFMMPFIVGSLGDRWYGLWVLAAAFVGYYGLLDLGLSRANERFISRALGREETDEVDEIFNTCFGLFCMAAILTLAASLIIVIITPHFVANAEEVRIFRIVTVVIGVTMAVSFPVRAFTGFLYSHIRYDVVNIIEFIKALVRTALIVFLLKSGHGIIAMAFIAFGVETAQCGVFVYYVLRKYPELNIGFGYFRKNRVRELLEYSVYSFIATIGDMLQFHLDAFVITAFVGLSMVTHYNIGARITKYYVLLITNAVALVMPVFSRMEGIKDYENIRKNYLFITKLNTIISVFVGGSLIIYGRAFILRWMGPQYSDSYDVLIILMIGLLFNSIQITSKTVLFGLSKHRMYAITVTLEGLANLALSLILVRKYGILGVAMGTTIPILITNIFVIPAYTNRVVKLQIYKYAKIVLGTLVLGAAIHFGSWLLIRDLILDSYKRILILGVTTSVVFIILNTFIVLNRDERKKFRIPI